MREKKRTRERERESGRERERERDINSGKGEGKRAAWLWTKTQMSRYLLRGKESGMVVDKDTDVQRIMKAQICGTGKILQRLYQTAKRRI